MARLLVQTQSGRLFCFKVAFGKGENGKDSFKLIQKSEIALVAGETVTAISNGIVCL